MGNVDRVLRFRTAMKPREDVRPLSAPRWGELPDVRLSCHEFFAFGGLGDETAMEK